MNTGDGKQHNFLGPEMADADEQIAELEALQDDEEFQRLAALGEGAIAFVHFDPSSAKSQTVEALVHFDDLNHIKRGLYVHIHSLKDGRYYTGRIVEGPFYSPDALKRDSTPVQFIILNQGKGKMLTLPEYHGLVQVEILGEEKDGVLSGIQSRPHPASPVKPYDTAMMEGMLGLHGNIILGLLDSYEDVFVRIDGNDKGVMPRNWLTVGTIGSGKSNTNQVFIEETLKAGYAQVVIDPEGEYIFMDEPTNLHRDSDLEIYGCYPEGVKHITVYRPPNSASARENAIEFSVPFDSLPPELIAELTEMNSTQQMRFMFLYEQAIAVVRKQKRKVESEEDKSDHWDITGGYPGVTLGDLVRMLGEELDYYDSKKSRPASDAKPKTRTRKRLDLSRAPGDEEEDDSADDEEPMEIYCHKYQLKPLLRDAQDRQSYAALLKKLRELSMMGLFDRDNAPPLEMEKLSEPGHLSVIDMSDADSQNAVNIVIADLLARMYHHKMALAEAEQSKRKVFITIEEAHGFISREKQDKMEQTLDQLRRIARRGRKRWLSLHFVTQSPEHLPSELFELANNKIIHQTTGSQNLRVLKGAAGAVNEAIWDDVPTLGRGRAVVISSQFPHPLIVKIRPAASRRYYTE